MSIPQLPHRCPPAPYERVSMVAKYMKKHKAKGKLLIFDQKDEFIAQTAFFSSWDKHFGMGDGGMIEYYNNFDGGNIIAVKGRTLINEDYDEYPSDVACIIPEQQAAPVASHLGIADSTGWCPIHLTGMRSSLIPDVHVLGDAAFANPLPKSALGALQASRTLAIDLLRITQGLGALSQHQWNTFCYSLIDGQQSLFLQAEILQQGNKALINKRLNYTAPIVPVGDAEQWFTGVSQTLWPKP